LLLPIPQNFATWRKPLNHTQDFYTPGIYLLIVLKN
jgi:hypothetical protein